jgi:hypothetical protein
MMCTGGVRGTYKQIRQLVEKSYALEDVSETALPGLVQQAAPPLGGPAVPDQAAVPPMPQQQVEGGLLLTQAATTAAGLPQQLSVGTPVAGLRLHRSLSQTGYVRGVAASLASLAERHLLNVTC